MCLFIILKQMSNMYVLGFCGNEPWYILYRLTPQLTYLVPRSTMALISIPSTINIFNFLLHEFCQTNFSPIHTFLNPFFVDEFQHHL